MNQTTGQYLKFDTTKALIKTFFALNHTEEKFLVFPDHLVNWKQI